MSNHFSIRTIAAGDAEAMRAIYNWAVVHTTASFDVVERTPEQQRVWMETHDGAPYEALVATEEPVGTVIGYASLSAVSPKQGYRRAVENSVYVHPDWQGHGIGGHLLEALIVKARKQDFTTIVALISADNDASLRLHRRFGFVDAGLLRRVGWKFGREIDVIYLQLFLRDPSD